MKQNAYSFRKRAGVRIMTHKINATYQIMNRKLDIRYFLTTITCVIFTLIISAQGVGIGTNSPNPSAALDISSDSTGILIPRMTAAERDAITNPATGLMVFVTNDSSFYCFEGSAWAIVGGRGYLLVDADGDTKIQVEEGPDDDTIRFDMGGTEYFKMANGRLEVTNTGESVFLGRGAGSQDDLTTNRNVFIGDSTGTANTTGIANTAIGNNAFYSNIGGKDNVALGFSALYSNTSGIANTALGHNSLSMTTDGDANTASGQSALYSNTLGNRNTATGSQSLFFNTSGSENTAFGYRALQSNVTGAYNTALGYQAGFSVDDSASVFLGYNAGYFETAGSRLYIENSDADSANALIYGEFDNDLLRINGRLIATMGLSDADNDTKIQVEEGPDDDTIRFDIQGTEYYRMVKGRIDVDNTGGTVLIGRAAGSTQNLGSLDNDHNTFVGDSTGNGISLGNYNTAMGSKALSGGGGFHNVAIGFAALKSYSGFGGYNTALGTRAGYNATGRYNVFLGHEAGYHETKDSTLYISSTDADSANALIYGEFDNDLLRINGRLVATMGLSDADGNTRIQVEKGPDDDTIRFDMGGTEHFRMANGRLEVVNTAGSVFIGHGAGVADNLLAGQNVFIGDSSGIANTDGYLNVAIGADAFYSNTIGFFNTAVGSDALASSTSGDYNTAIGMNALQSNTTADFNTAVGYESLKSNLTGQHNTATGYQALLSNSTGWYNAAFGRQSLLSNQTGQHNTAMGNLSMEENIGGSQNVGIGRRALRLNTIGNNNTALGNDALYSNQTGSRNVALGTEAGYGSTGDNSVYIGNKAGYFETSGDRLYIENSDADSANALIYGEFDNDLLRINGRLIATMGLSDADNDTRIQVEEGMDDDTIRFDMGGVEHFRMANGRLEVVNTGRSVFIGRGAGASDNLTDNENVYVGDSTGAYGSGDYSTAVGTLALKNSSGAQNSAFGHGALESMNNGSANVAVGNSALNAISISEGNTAIGNLALRSLESGDYNVALGNVALRNNLSGSNNVALGYRAGRDNDGSGNVFLGNESGLNEAGSNRLYIENSNAVADSALIYGEFDNNILAFNADVGIGTTTPAHDLHVIGNSLLRDTLRSTLTLQTDLNSKDVGLAFRRQGLNYEWNIFREGSSTDLVFSGGNDSDITLLTEFMRLTDAGQLGIGTSAPDQLLTVNGNASKSAGGVGWAAFSDRRLKDVEGTYDRGLDEIMQLQPVFFRYKTDNAKGLQSTEQNVGFVAQEVQPVIPEAIDDSGDYLSLQADPIFWAMLNSIKELKMENDDLTRKYDQLLLKLTQMEKELSQQKK